MNNDADLITAIANLILLKYIIKASTDITNTPIKIYDNILRAVAVF